MPSSSARRRATSSPSRRSIMSRAIPASSTAACATTRNSPSLRARIFPAPDRSDRGSSTPDEIPDPSKLTLTTRLNGTQVQHSPTDLLIYSIPQIIAFCSDFTPLSPGDVIATGTPEGVGHSRKPPLWMKPGDVLEVEITGIGTLRARVGRRALSALFRRAVGQTRLPLRPRPAAPPRRRARHGCRTRSVSLRPINDPNSATPSTLPVCRVELSTPAAMPERDFSTLPSSVDVIGGTSRPSPPPMATSCAQIAQ